MWEINKNYIQTEFNDNDTSLGYTISVYQETINKTFPEFLVNFEYLTELIENYGFTPLTPEELETLGFVSSIGSFSLLFDDLKKNIKQTPRLKKIVGTSIDMNHNEKKISFLNNYFIFRKRRPVNAESVFNSIIRTKTRRKIRFRKLKTKIILKMKK
jgi:hypothetical protein